jgi:hypothetical protein
MVGIKTGKILPKLEEVLNFSLGRGSEKKYPIIIGDLSPATDGTKIFMPRKFDKLKDEKDNELSLANSTAHEADHIKELNEHLGMEADSLRQSEENLVAVYLQRNYSELTENQALAGFIDNIVKDRRIDAVRRKNFPAIERHYTETLIPSAQYFRPSTGMMSELDAFRELYLQQALLGKTIEAVPQKRKEALEKIVSLTLSADSISKDPQVVKQIYQVFKDNFDITQKMSKLPSIFGTNNHSGSPSESQNYNGETKPRDGRDEKDKRPEKLAEPSKDKKSNGKEDSTDNKDNKNNQETKDNNDDSDPKYKPHSKDETGFYKNQSKENGMQINFIDELEKQNPSIAAENESCRQLEKELSLRYSGEIESMKRIFRQLKLRHYGDKRYFEGQELDFEEHLQADLESRATGIRVSRKTFLEKTQNQQKPIFAIHADKSGSTKGDIIEAIRAAFYIMGNALSASDYNYSMYVSNSQLDVLKSPSEKYSGKINRRISQIASYGSGIYFERTSSIIANDLRRFEGNPKCMVVISDFECEEGEGARKTVKKLYESKIYPLLIAIGQEHEVNAKALTEEVGSEYYSVVPIDKLHELPGKIFRLLKTYGIAR